MFTETDAADAAKKLGLQSVGFGRWADKSGKVVAKTVDGRLTPNKPKSDPPSKSKPSMPIHRDFKPTKSSAPNIPSNRMNIPANPEADPIKTLEPEAPPVKRSEPNIGKVSDDERRAAGDYVPDDDPDINPDRKPKFDGSGNRIKSKDDGGKSNTQKKFRRLVKGVDYGVKNKPTSEQSQTQDDFKDTSKKPEKKMKLGNAMKSIKDKFR